MIGAVHLAYHATLNAMKQRPMKSIVWNGPDVLIDARIRRPESTSDSMDRLHHEKHAKFRRWQDAMQMNMIFGDNYVTVPEIPKGYEEYAKWWYDNELKAFK